MLITVTSITKREKRFPDRFCSDFNRQLGSNLFNSYLTLLALQSLNNTSEFFFSSICFLFCSQRQLTLTLGVCACFKHTQTLEHLLVVTDVTQHNSSYILGEQTKVGLKGIPVPNPGVLGVSKSVRQPLRLQQVEAILAQVERFTTSVR